MKVSNPRDVSVKLATSSECNGNFLWMLICIMQALVLAYIHSVSRLSIHLCRV